MSCKEAISTLALVGCLMAGPQPAASAVLQLRDGTTVDGEIRGTLVQRLSVQQQIPGKAIMAHEHIYLLTRGEDVISLGAGGLHRSGGAQTIVVAHAISDMTVTHRGQNREWSPVWEEPDDAAVFSSILGGWSAVPADTSLVLGDVALVPGPPSVGETHSVLPVLGELPEDPGEFRFQPVLTVTVNGRDREVPVADLAAPEQPAVVLRDGVMKARASGVAEGGYRLTAVEAENSMRPSIMPRLGSTEKRSILSPDATGSIWHFRCALESGDGIGFNLAMVVGEFGLTDEQGRELMPFEVLGSGFQSFGSSAASGQPDGFLEFLALGPGDSRTITVRYGDGSITVPME